jgi:hypothetical protein
MVGLKEHIHMTFRLIMLRQGLVVYPVLNNAMS